MAADLVIIDGDKAIFIPVFGAAIVAVKPGKMAGTGKTTIGGKNVCVLGDEANLEVPGCNYFTASHVKPGSGTIKIKSLAGNQKAKKTKSGGKEIIIKGAQFNAVFEIQTPAEDITPVASGGSPIPDPKPSYNGKGLFIPSNVKVKVS